MSFHTTSFDELSRISFASYEASEFLQELSLIEGLNEFFILATCNRLEIYAFGASGEEHGFKILEKLAEKRRIEVEKLKAESYVLSGNNALRHLFNVACGTDSLIVGELEILSQIRRAIEVSRNAGLLGNELNKIVHRALEVGRRARQETNISRGHLSISSEAVALAEQKLGTLDKKTAVILGSGELGEVTAKVLAKSTNASLILCNRTAETARLLAQEIGEQAQGGCEAVGFEDIISVLQVADLVVCATGAPHYILNESMIRMIQVQRPERPLVLLDLSLPRNIDPAVKQLPGVSLLTIEDLQQQADKNRDARLSEIEKVKAFVEGELHRFLDSFRRLPSQELTSELRREIEAIRKKHLETYQDRFPEENREYLDLFTNTMVSQILHRLTKNLKNVDSSTAEGKQALQFAQEFFDLGAPAPQESGCPLAAHHQNTAPTEEAS